VELDIHSTRDGVLVVHHDETVNGQAIARATFAELDAVRLANGEPLATLAEALDVIHPMTAFVEVKGLAAEWDENLFAAFEGSPAPDRIAVHAFDHRIVRRLGEKRAGLARGVLSTSYPINVTRMMTDAGATALWQHAALVDEALVRQVHGIGGVVYAWTVDAPDAMQRLLAMGVDGLCSNHPDRARTAVDSHPRD
jgi:glycerophosphoryl diester phosphodiesterase